MRADPVQQYHCDLGRGGGEGRERGRERGRQGREGEKEEGTHMYMYIHVVWTHQGYVLMLTWCHKNTCTMYDYFMVLVYSYMYTCTKYMCTCINAHVHVHV